MDNTLQLPRLNEPAPDFASKTTHGMKQLSDYQGKWLILFSHPADFTPVCTTEFIGFTKAYPELSTSSRHPALRSAIFAASCVMSSVIGRTVSRSTTSRRRSA